MKKVFLTVLIINTIFFTVHAQSGIVRELTGDVQIQQAGSSAFTAAKVGDRVSQDTIVSTGFRSSALVEIGSAVITIRPLTRLSLAEIQSSSGSETMNVNLQTGRVRVDVNPPAGARANAAVQTPSATASVRGTSFEMDTRNLTVLSGSVNWQDSTGFSAAVAKGYSSSLSRTGSLVDPVEMAARDLSPTAPTGSGEAGENSSSNIPSSAGVDVDVDISYF